MPEPSLLPQNATRWEQAQELTDAQRWPLPVHLIKDVWNPDTCPLELLPYFAAGLGFEIWDDSWTEQKQREVCWNIWRYKRNKTKLKGIAGYAGLAGAKVIGAARPRDKRWWSGGQTEAQREAQMAWMPEIRIPVYPPQGIALPVRKFWGGRHTIQTWSAGKVWQPSDAYERYVSRASYVDRGVTTPITVKGIDGPLDANLRVELRQPSSVAKMFWGRRRSAWGAGAVFMASDAGEHVIAITPSLDGMSFAVPAGLVPVTVRPVRVVETAPCRPGQRFWGAGHASHALYWGTRGFYTASDAERHVYDRLTLFDPTRLGPSRQPFSFWGSSRWGRAAFTSELRLDVTLTRGPFHHGYGRPWGRNFWRKADMEPLWRALTAVKASQAFRDTVWVDLRLHEPITFSPGLRFGDAGFSNFGDVRKLK